MCGEAPLHPLDDSRRGQTRAGSNELGGALALEGGRSVSFSSEQHQAILRASHEKQYLAILDGAVVDHDGEFAALAERIFERYGVRSIFMPRVEAGPEKVRYRSPRVARR